MSEIINLKSILAESQIKVLLVSAFDGEIYGSNIINKNEPIPELVLKIEESFVLVGAKFISLSEVGWKLEIDIANALNKLTPYISYRIDYFSIVERTNKAFGLNIGKKLIHTLLPKFLKCEKLISIPYQLGLLKGLNYPSESNWGYLNDDNNSDASLPSDIEEGLLLLWVPPKNTTLNMVLQSAMQIDIAITEFIKPFKDWIKEIP